MFVRFVVTDRDENSHRLTGVFQEAFRLRDRGLLNHAEFEKLRQWFNLHLPVPDRFSRSRRPHAHCNAICWFKSCITVSPLRATLVSDDGVGRWALTMSDDVL